MSCADIKAGSRIENMDNHTYHAAVGLSSSAIKYFYHHSPAHYFHHYVLSERQETTSAAQLLGTLVHCLVLEPDAFDKRYQKEISKDDYPNALRTVADLRGYCEQNNLKTDGLKQDLIDRIAAHDPTVPIWDNLLLKPKQDNRDTIDSELWDKARRMRDSVLNNTEIARLFSRGDAEVSVWGCHEPTGMLTKCRCDWLREDGIVVDLKTCLNASPGGFSTACAKYDYVMQQVHYMETLNSAGYGKDEFVFVAVENEPPYVSTYYVMDEHSVQVTESAYHATLARLHSCQQQKQWPAYTGDTVLSLPLWKLEQMWASHA